MLWMHGELQQQHSSSSISLSPTHGSSQLPSSLAAKHVHCPHCIVPILIETMISVSASTR